jgi:hypothetical protein
MPPPRARKKLGRVASGVKSATNVARGSFNNTLKKTSGSNATKIKASLKSAISGAKLGYKAGTKSQPTTKRDSVLTTSKNSSPAVKGRLFKKAVKNSITKFIEPSSIKKPLEFGFVKKALKEAPKKLKRKLKSNYKTARNSIKSESVVAAGKADRKTTKAITNLNKTSNKSQGARARAKRAARFTKLRSKGK